MFIVNILPQFIGKLVLHVSRSSSVYPK